MEKPNDNYIEEMRHFLKCCVKKNKTRANLEVLKKNYDYLNDIFKKVF